ncbi:MAG: ABC transporter substrate-binding protein [Methanotrichaceae archaeon]
MKRISVPVLIVFMLLLSMTVMGANTAIASPSSGQLANRSTNQSTISEAIKIAGGFDLSGGESSLDLPAANGAKLAVKEINASGGVMGRPLDLIIRNADYNMSATARIARQFIEDDKVVGGIGFSDTNSMLAAGPVFQSAGIPFITVGATSPKIPGQIGDMIYLACFGDNAQAAAGAEYGARSFGTSAYLLVDTSTDYTVLLADYFNKSFGELGGEIVLKDSYSDNTTNVSGQIAKLKNLPKQPDFYYIAAMPYNVVSIIKQFRDAGLTGPIIGGDGYDIPEITSIGGKTADNIFFSTHALMDNKTGSESIRTFIAAYNKEYGHNPENAFAALGYDAMRLMADAIKRAGSTDPEAIRKAIQETSDFPGITGSISYMNGTHVPEKSITIIAIKDGKYTLGAEIIPENVPAP